MSQLEVDKIIPQSGTTLTLGDSGDTINFGSGVLPNFENLTVTGDLTVDTNSLKVDSTNNRVGIGTASPSINLEIKGSGSNSQVYLSQSTNSTYAQIYSDSDGTFIIGADQGNTASGSSIRLKVDSSEAIRINSSGQTLIGTTVAPTNADTKLMVHVPISSSSRRAIEISHNTNGANKPGAALGLSINNGGEATNAAELSFSTASSGSLSERMRITSSGNVGIGTTSPTSFLANSTTLEISDSDNYGSEIILTNNSPMSDNEIVGSLIFKNTDASGTPPHYAGIRARAENVFGSMDLEFYAGRDVLESGGTPHMMIEANAGNVGIGTASPVGKLDVRGEQDFVNQDGVNDSGAINAVSDIDTNNGSDAVASLAFKAPYSTGNSDRVVYGAITGHKNNSVQGQRYGNLRFYTNSSSAVTERMRIDSSGNVLVGKTSTSSAIAGTTLWNGGYLNSTVASDYVARFNRTTTDGDIIQIYKDNSAVGSIGSSSTALKISTPSEYLTFFTDSDGDNEEVVWDSAQTGGTWRPGADNTSSIGYSARRWKDLYLSGSVYLGGTGSANALDDYEEGTWTPVVTGSTSGSYTGSNVGLYVKIGDLVAIEMSVAHIDNNDVSGDLTVTGLPFTKASTTDMYVDIVGYAINWSSTYTQLYGFFPNNSTALELNWAIDNSASIRVTNSDLSGSASFLRAQFIYRTA